MDGTIKKFVFQTNSKEIELSFEELKRLKDIIDDLFAKDIVLANGDTWWWRNPIYEHFYTCENKSQPWRTQPDIYYIDGTLRINDFKDIRVSEK